MSKNKRNRYDRFESNDEQLNDISEKEFDETVLDPEPQEEESEETAQTEDPVEEAVAEAINKISEVENREPDGVRIPSMLNEPDHIGKNKRRVKSKRLRLRKEPSKIGDILEVLSEGDVVDIDSKFVNADWYKVVNEDGSERGYVMKTFVSEYA